MLLCWLSVLEKGCWKHLFLKDGSYTTWRDWSLWSLSEYHCCVTCLFTWIRADPISWVSDYPEKIPRKFVNIFYGHLTQNLYTFLHVKSILKRRLFHSQLNGKHEGNVIHYLDLQQLTKREHAHCVSFHSKRNKISVRRLFVRPILSTNLGVSQSNNFRVEVVSGFTE